MSDVMIVKRKAKIERDLKTCTVQLVGKRGATNYETGKPLSIYFSMVATFSIEPNKRFKEWTLTKIIKPYKFSWMRDFAVKTIISLCDGEQSQILDVTAEQQYGVSLEFSPLVKISTKEASELIAQGAKVCELDQNSDTIATGDGLPIVRFSRR